MPVVTADPQRAWTSALAITAPVGSVTRMFRSAEGVEGETEYEESGAGLGSVGARAPTLSKAGGTIPVIEDDSATRDDIQNPNAANTRIRRGIEIATNRDICDS